MPGQARGHPQDVGTGGQRVAVKAAGELQPAAASAVVVVKEPTGWRVPFAPAEPPGGLSLLPFAQRAICVRGFPGDVPPDRIPPLDNQFRRRA